MCIYIDLPDKPFSLDPAFAVAVRDVLDQADFTDTGILQRLGANQSIQVGFKDIPRLLQHTGEGTPLDVFIRLFTLGAHVSLEQARQAVAPMALDAWIDGGLLARGAAGVYAPLRMVWQSGKIILFDPPSDPDHGVRSADFVPGPGSATMGLVSATVRDRMTTALDVGTGCGIQAFLCSDHADRVVATDINPRALNITAFGAALNGISNIEVLPGSLFEPVADRQFDLILMNPPFAICPENQFMYRDGGMEADGFVETVIRTAPAHLTPGGLLQITAQWACRNNEPWARRLEAWFAKTQCDVWVIELENAPAEQYAVKWIGDVHSKDRESFVTTWNHWMAFYRTRGITSVCTGLITMRKRPDATPWYFISSDVDGLDMNAGKAITKGLKLRDFLNTLADAADILDVPLRLSPDAVLQTLSHATSDGWRPARYKLEIPTGIHISGSLDGAVVELLGGCNGTRPLADLVADLAARVGANGDDLAATVAPLACGLVERAFLLPPGID